jgi:hypothetical protein
MWGNGQSRGTILRHAGLMATKFVNRFLRHFIHLSSRLSCLIIGCITTAKVIIIEHMLNATKKMKGHNLAFIPAPRI